MYGYLTKSNKETRYGLDEEVLSGHCEKGKRQGIKCETTNQYVFRFEQEKDRGSEK